MGKVGEAIRLASNSDLYGNDHPKTRDLMLFHLKCRELLNFPSPAIEADYERILKAEIEQQNPVVRRIANIAARYCDFLKKQGRDQLCTKVANETLAAIKPSENRDRIPKRQLASLRQDAQFP